jgi:hypothetical protein
LRDDQKLARSTHFSGNLGRIHPDFLVATQISSELVLFSGRPYATGGHNGQDRIGDQEEPDDPQGSGEPAVE